MSNVSILNPPSITGTAGGTLTLVPGQTANAVAVTYQWYRDLLPIPGATGMTIDSSAWAGQISVVQTAQGDGGPVTAMSALFDNGINQTQVFSDTFDAAVNNQPFTSYAAAHGWTVSGGDAANQAKYLQSVNSGDGSLTWNAPIAPVQVGGVNSYATCHFDVGSPNQAIEIQNANAGLSYGPPIMLWWRDDSNFVYLTYGGVTGGQVVNVNQVINGNISLLGTYHVPDFDKNGVARVEIIGGVLYYKYRKPTDTSFTQYALNKASKSALTIGTDGQALTFNAGTGMGVYGAGSLRFITSVRGYSINLPVVIGTIGSDTLANVPKLTLNASYVGTPSGFDVAVMGADGSQLVSRTAATVTSMSGGQAVLTLTSANLRAGEGKTIYVQIWPTGQDTGSARVFAMPVYQTVFAYRQGINEGGLGQGKPNDWSRDLAHNANWRAGGTWNFLDSIPGYDPQYNNRGFPSSYPPGSTSLRALLPWVTDSTPDRLGTYTVTVPAGMTPVSGQDSPITQVNGVYKLNRIDNHRVVTQYIEVTGPIPAGGGYLSITQDGDAHPERTVTDAAANSYRALGKILRCMTARKVNSPTYKNWTPQSHGLYAASERISLGSATDFPLSVEFQTAMCNESGLDMWHNDLPTVADDYRQAEAAYVAANLAPSLSVEIEYSNEIWNNGFQQYWEVALEGCRNGFAPDSVTSQDLAVPETIWSNSNPGDPNSSVPKFDYPAGTKVLFKINGYGLAVYQALSDQTAGGNPVPSDGSSDSNWQMVYDFAHVTRARYKQQAYASARCWDIWDTAFANVGRPRTRHIIGMQTTSDITTQSPALDFGVMYNGQIVPLRTITDKIAMAPYWRGKGANLGDYNSTPTGPHPFGQTEKNLIATDINAFRAAFWAAAYDGIDDIVATAKAGKHSIARYCVANGLSADAIQLCSYEANWHVQFCNWPANLKDLANAEFGNLMRSPEYGTATAYYIDQIRQNLGGTHVMFDRIGKMPTANSDNPLRSAEQNWAIEDGEWDTATSGATQNYRYTAFANGNAG